MQHKETVHFSHYRLPAEWEQQKALCLIWPENQETWKEHLTAVQKEIVQFIKIILQYQQVYLFSQDPNLFLSFPDSKYSLSIFPHLNQDCWARDYGGVCLVHRKKKLILLLDFEFNSWGGKYLPCDQDNDFPLKMAKSLELKTYSVNMVLEGGSIETNGQGLLLTNKKTLLNPNRNPNLVQKEIERNLKKYLGVQDILWLSSEIAGDDTDGHIDQLVRFISPKKVLCPLVHDKRHIHYSVLKQNYFQMQEYVKRYDLKLIEFVHPPELLISNLITPASYMNFVFVNGAILLPSFGVKEDYKAVEILQSLNLGLKIEQIPSQKIVFGQGGIHCLSLNIFDH